jgi:hypothetical protein
MAMTLDGGWLEWVSTFVVTLEGELSGRLAKHCIEQTR